VNALRVGFATCAACIAFLAVARAQDTAGDVATTLQQTRAALGAETLQRGGTLLLESTVTANGLNGEGNSAAEIGGARLAERASTPPIVNGDGYDGTAVWFQDQTGLVWQDGSDAGTSQEIDEAYAADDTLFVPGSGAAKVAWGGVRVDNGRRYTTLSVTPLRSLVPMEVWIDAGSRLPARYVITVGPINYETDVSEYRPVDGLLVPYRLVSKSNEGNSSDITVTSARIVANDEAVFAKPQSQVDDFSMSGGGASTSVPIELIDNHVYLNVMLDGKGPYRFVFDTGGSNIIDPAVAKDIDAVGSGSAQDSGTGAETESFSYATVDSLQVGNAVLRHQVFAVESVRQGFGVGSGQRVDGLIGFEVLARYVTTFDYARRTVTLAMPGGAPPAGADGLPLVFAGQAPQVACTIDGIPSECTVDTGASSSVNLLAPFIAAHPQIVPATHSDVGVNGYGVGGGNRGYLGRLRSLQLGTFTLRDLVAGYSTQTKGFLAQPFIAANVGAGVWKRFTVTFDYAKMTMALQPNASVGERDSHERSGLFLITEAGKIDVYGVRPGTPAAEAGIVKGDVILTIDGAAPHSLEQVRDAMYGAAGSILRLRVADANGKVRVVTLTLRDLV
jgi:hypothetical protein